MSASLAKNAKKPEVSPLIVEISTLCDEVTSNMRRTLGSALLVGSRLLWLHRQTAESNTPGGFKAALEAIADRVPRSTAYRWINAATTILAAHQGEASGQDLRLPEPGTEAWHEIEKILLDKAQGMSLRRLLIGSSDVSEESRLDGLIIAEEDGDKNATAILEQVAAGKYTLVQAIRALGGSKAKEKTRTDPVYLDLDGITGQPTGLFPKCLITIGNTFQRWEQLDETARREVKAVWKATVANLPKELR